MRVLENGEYQRVGETATRKSNARIIAATNRDPRQAVRECTFRSDLYHRLSVFSITVPSLRELGPDKLVLLDISRIFTPADETAFFRARPDAVQAGNRYCFPGNTRELRNIVIRLTTKYPVKSRRNAQLEDEFDPGHCRAEARYHCLAVIIKQQLFKGGFGLDGIWANWRALAAALGILRWQRHEAAKLLGVNRTYAAVQCGTVYAEQFGGFADIAGGKLQSGGDIVTFLFTQVPIQAESALGSCCFIDSEAVTSCF